MAVWWQVKVWVELVEVGIWFTKNIWQNKNTTLLNNDTLMPKVYEKEQ